jgi:hypothetical protein
MAPFDELDRVTGTKALNQLGLWVLPQHPQHQHGSIGSMVPVMHSSRSPIPTYNERNACAAADALEHTHCTTQLPWKMSYCRTQRSIISTSMPARRCLQASDATGFSCSNSLC